MSQLRRNRLTGGWVVYAPERAIRPHGGDPAMRDGRPSLPERDPDCPFCPGNEARIPALLYQHDRAAAPGWQIRVIANLYPIIDGIEAPDGDSLVGRHEVIIEHPRHDMELAAMDAAEMAALLDAWRARVAALWADPETAAVTLFRNRGRAAGISLDHPHTQILSLGTVPPAMERLERLADGHRTRHGGCLACAVLNEEKAGLRLIDAVPGFFAFVPFAAQVSCECWIMPERHEVAFNAITATKIEALAALLLDVLRRLRDHAGDPQFNLVLHNPSRAADPGSAHWWLRILPRHKPTGGFELGTGVEINASLPEADAARLRGEG